MNIPKIIVSTVDLLKHKSIIENNYYALSEIEKDSPKGYALDTLFHALSYSPVKFLGANFILISSLYPWITVHYKAVIKRLDKNEVRYTTN